jgi:hypothetical protein
VSNLPHPNGAVEKGKKDFFYTPLEDDVINMKKAVT